MHDELYPLDLMFVKPGRIFAVRPQSNHWTSASQSNTRTLRVIKRWHAARTALCSVFVRRVHGVDSDSRKCKKAIEIKNVESPEAQPALPLCERTGDMAHTGLQGKMSSIQKKKDCSIS